jgi:hypothetical protein
VCLGARQETAAEYDRLAGEMGAEAKRWQEVADKNQAHFDHLVSAMDKVTSQSRLLALTRHNTTLP